MGRYSSDSDDSHYSRRSKKKKTKSRRSRSRSSSADSYARRSKKSKKKSKKRSRSRSRSSDRYRRRRSRSRSRDRRRSRSTSRHRSSRRSRTRSKSPPRSSRRYTHSHSKTPDRYKRSESPARSKDIKQEIKQEKEEEPTEDPCLSIPGFESMSLLQQNDLRMQMALKAAAATDERLRKEGLLPVNVGRSLLSVEEQARRAQAISQIDGDAFVQQTFLSNRAEKPPSSAPDVSSNATHENAMFSNLPIKMENPGEKKLKITYTDPDCLMGPALYEDPEVKMDRWIKKLTAMRRRKLEGEAMS